jgi:hypothetical protein
MAKNIAKIQEECHTGESRKALNDLLEVAEVSGWSSDMFTAVFCENQVLTAWEDRVSARMSQAEPADLSKSMFIVHGNDDYVSDNVRDDSVILGLADYYDNYNYGQVGSSALCA